LSQKVRQLANQRNTKSNEAIKMEKTSTKTGNTSTTEDRTSPGKLAFFIANLTRRKKYIHIKRILIFIF
jgi:hypothetical protein